MIDAIQIRSLAAEAGIDPGVLEKDYVLSKALMALSQVKLFTGNLVFKGGTALKKCYYPQWRFSEDLDFTSRRPMSRTEVKKIFDECVDVTASLFGLTTRVIEYSQYPKAGDNLVTAQLKIGYDGPLRKSNGQKNNVRVDIAFDETIVNQPVTRDVLAGYADDIAGQVPVYTLEEIAAEKLRSILQRGKSRDYYDVWILLAAHSPDFSGDIVASILRKKCEYKDMAFPSVDDFFLPDTLAEAPRFWERGLAHQLRDLPDFDSVLRELRQLLSRLLA